MILRKAALCPLPERVSVQYLGNMAFLTPWTGEVVTGLGCGGLSEPLCPEMHRTQTRFEDAFTLKVFIFQFVNFYSSPIYIGFFKGRSARLPLAAPHPEPCANPCGPRGSG